MKALISIAISCLVVTSAAAAQQTIPSDFLTTPGASYTNYPFGLANARVQYLYDTSVITPPVLPINQLDVRGQENIVGNAKTATIEIRLSTSAAVWNAASTTFTSNVGPDESVCFSPKAVNLPGYASSASPGFPTSFKLDKAFVYLRARGNLLIDYFVTGGSSTAYPSNCAYGRAVASSTIGTSCQAASQSFTGGSSLTATSTLAFNLSAGPANGAAVQILGFQKLPQAVPLPNGNCPLHIVPLLLVGAATSATGTATVTYPIPVGTRALVGPVVYSQWVALGAIWDSSPAIEVSIGGYLPCVRIYNLSSSTATTGSTQLGVGVVHRVQ